MRAYVAAPLASLGLALSAGLSSSACTGGDQSRFDITVQELRAGDDGLVGLDLLVTTSDGRPVACDEGTMTATVSAVVDGVARPVPARDVVVACASGAADVALVIDNSGSVAGHLEGVKAGAAHLAERVIDAGGRASLVRVSTTAEVQVELGRDTAALDDAIGSMYVNRGWTALYDGIRRGNETLGGAADEGLVGYSDVASFCSASRKLAIVAFTDGGDNNSADEQAYDHDAYPSDGLATTLADLQKLRVDRISTPIYTIGFGDQVDEAALVALATASGARHRTLSAEGDPTAAIDEAFTDIAAYVGSSHQVCADLPATTCGDVEFITSWTWQGEDGTTQHGETHSSIHVPCEPDAAGAGRTATIVLTMSDRGIARPLARQLATNAVRFVAPATRPEVLVVLDDGHHGEAVGDAAYVRDLLAEADQRVTLITEPRGGLRPEDVAGYDVVWFSNPGYPWDDQRSYDTLVAFAADGGGVIAQGDDITSSLGRSFDVSGLTKLVFRDNGTQTCGKTTDNNAGRAFAVALGAGHPLVSGIEGATFSYGDDVDASVALGGGEVVAGQASFAHGSCAVQRPVLVGFDPEA